MQNMVKREVIYIPAKSERENKVKKVKNKLRVAAYCRVSTLQEQQEQSYEAQIEYFTNLIEENPDWKMVDIYAEMKIAKMIQFEKVNPARKARNKGF